MFWVKRNVAKPFACYNCFKESWRVRRDVVVTERPKAINVRETII